MHNSLRRNETNRLTDSVHGIGNVVLNKWRINNVHIIGIIIGIFKSA